MSSEKWEVVVIYLLPCRQPAASTTYAAWSDHEELKYHGYKDLVNISLKPWFPEAVAVDQFRSQSARDAEHHDEANKVDSPHR